MDEKEFRQFIRSLVLLGSQRVNRVFRSELWRLGIYWRGLTSKGLYTRIRGRLPRECSVKSEKIQKIQGFSFENLVFKSFFLHKILVHPKKIRENPEKTKNLKNSKNLKKSNKTKVFFWGFKIRTPYLGVNNPSAVTYPRSTRPSNRRLIDVFSVLYTYNIRSKARGRSRPESWGDWGKIGTLQRKK